jgi:hypothetical protein
MAHQLRSAIGGQIRVYGICSYASIITIIVSILFAIAVPKVRHACLYVVAAGIIIFAMFLIAGKTVGLKTIEEFFMVPHETFEPVVQRGQPLIDAIESYHKDRGEYPTSLQELVPAYLKGIPNTELAGFPEFLYEKGNAAIPYKITVDLSPWPKPAGDYAKKELMYWPTGNDKYPFTKFGFRVGKWMYFSGD